MRKLAASLFLLWLVPTVSAQPNLTGLNLERDNFNVVAGHSQCSGDEVSLRITTDQTIGTGGISAYVLNSDTGATVTTWTNVQTHPDWFNVNNRLLHTSVEYSTGEYVFVATIDVTGVLTPDLFSAWPFSVPVGSCKDAVQDGSQSLIVTQHQQTRSLVNSTTGLLQTEHLTQGLYAHCQNTTVQSPGDCQGIHANLTQVHTHLDAHFGDLCNGVCNFTVENEPVLQAIEAQQMRLPGLETPESWLLVFCVGLLLWSLTRKDSTGANDPMWIPAVFATIGALTVFVTDTGWALVTVCFFLLIGFWLEVWRRNVLLGGEP